MSGFIIEATAAIFTTAFAATTLGKVVSFVIAFAISSALSFVATMLLFRHQGK
jgi:hypothetical protein